MDKMLDNQGRDFTMRIAELVRYFRENGQGFAICDRLLYCGLTAGLYIRKGKHREAAELLEEADYIIELAVTAGYLSQNQDEHIRADCANLLKMLDELQTTKKQEGTIL